MNISQTLTELKNLKKNELSTQGLDLISILIHSETPKLECIPSGMKSYINLSFLEEGVIVKITFPQIESKPTYEFSIRVNKLKIECNGEKSYFSGRKFLPQEIVNFHESNKSDIFYDFGMESKYKN